MNCKDPNSGAIFLLFPCIIIVDIPYFVLPFMLKLLIEVYGYPVYLKTSPGFYRTVWFLLSATGITSVVGLPASNVTLLRPFIYGRRILDYMIATKEEKREIDEYEDKQLEESLEEIKETSLVVTTNACDSKRIPGVFYLLGCGLPY